ncbi:zinc-RING finger domain [Teratosphaeria destructans]|uniref:Zinc-RING finger domain n=1 Tax=Teratosphaeria destructans TaxID=418781 RepID=A0A9W7T0E2_9PEZI|nr:zinc-RING finger domain [Teratosphaeria destructans]
MSYGRYHQLGAQQQQPEYVNIGADWTFDDLPAVNDRPDYSSSSSGPSPSPPAPPSHERSREGASHDQPTTSAASTGLRTSRSHMSGVNRQQQQQHQQNPAEAGGTRREGRHTTFAYSPNISHLHTLSGTSSPRISEFSYNAVPRSDDHDDHDDHDDDEEEHQQQSAAAMAPASRRRTQPRSRVVDLTDSPQPSAEGGTSAPAAPSRPLKRPAPTDSDTTHSTKRTAAPTPRSPPEELDLTADNDTDSFLQQQQAATIAAQQAASPDSPNGPIKIGNRTCIICMEHYTNAAVTPCGHIYCHECLTQALKAGERNSERGLGNCPMCRKPVSRKKNQVVPVAFMKRSAFRGKKRAGA